jgi:hypothetical protein
MCTCPHRGTSSRSDISTITNEYITFLPESTWVVVHVNGTINTATNPGCASLPPYWACPFGPIGSAFNATYPWDGGPVSLQALGETWDVLGLRGTGGNTGGSAGSAVGLRYQSTAGVLYGRLGISGSASSNPNGDPNDVASYFLSGGYDVEAKYISSPIEIAGVPLGDSLGTNRYTISPAEGLALINPYGVPSTTPAGQVIWTFVVGDTVSENPRSGGETWTISGCNNLTTCDWAPPQQGRMQAEAWVETLRAKVRFDYVKLEAAPDTGPGCPHCGELPLTEDMEESVIRAIDHVQCPSVRDLLTERLSYMVYFTQQPDQFDNPGPRKLQMQHINGAVYIWDGMWSHDPQGNLRYDSQGRLIYRDTSQFVKDIVHEGAHMLLWSQGHVYDSPLGVHDSAWREIRAQCGYPGTTG